VRELAHRVSAERDTGIEVEVMSEEDARQAFRSIVRHRINSAGCADGGSRHPEQAGDERHANVRKS
jgi:hypothetical protein